MPGKIDRMVTERITAPNLISVKHVHFKPSNGSPKSRKNTVVEGWHAFPLEISSFFPINSTCVNKKYYHKHEKVVESVVKSPQN